MSMNRYVHVLVEIYTRSRLAKGRYSVYISRDGRMWLETLPLEVSGKVLSELSDALTAEHEASVALGTEPGKPSPECNNSCPH